MNTLLLDAAEIFCLEQQSIKYHPKKCYPEFVELLSKDKRN